MTGFRERIDTNKNNRIDVSSQCNEINNFILDKNKGEENLNELGKYLNNLDSLKLDNLGIKDALQSYFTTPERIKLDQEIKNKVNKNEPLTKKELNLLYLEMISKGNNQIGFQKQKFDSQQLKFDSSKPVDQICDGALIGFIRTKYNFPTYTGKKVKIDLPNKTKKKTNNPIDKIQESKGGNIKLPENIGEIKESEADFYCDRLITRAEKNFANDIEKAKREIEQNHRYKDEEEKKAYIKRDTLLIAFSKYTEAINSQHEKHITNSGYKDKDDFENQMKLIEKFGKEIEKKYPNINNILEKIQKFDEEMKANEKKYFKNENETKKAEKNYKEFNEYMDKKSKEYDIDKIQESLKKEPKTKEEMEEYLQTMNKIFEFQEDLNKKNKTNGNSISKYQKYIKGAADIQKKHNIQQYQEILEKYNQDITNWNKKIDFKKYENYKNGLDWKLEVGLKNINTLQGIITDPNKNKNILVKEFKDVENKQQIKQNGIDRIRERIKKFSPGAYWTLTTFTGLWNGLIDATLGVSTSLGVMILGIIGGTDETLSQMDRKARRDNFFKINQSSSQKESVYDSETGFNFHADNTVSTVASSISQMLTLIYGGGAIGSGASKVLGISENIAGRVGLFTSSFITQVGGSYQEAITHGLTGKNAIGYSFLSATIQSSLELVSPNDVLLGKGNGITKELIRNACNEGGKQSFMLIGKTFLKNVGLEILEENIQEGLQTAAGNLINMVVNGTYGSKLGADWSWKNFAATAIITTLTTGITTGVSTGVQMYEMSNQDQTKLLEHIKSDNGLYLEVTGMLDKAIEGKVSIPNVSIDQLQNLKLTLTGNSNINTPSTNTNIQTEYEIKMSPEIEQISQILGSRFHEERRQSRLQSDGTYAPRIEKVTDQTWISQHNGQTEVDIANTPFEDLPSDWKSENLEAAKVAVGLIYDMVKNGEKVTSEMIEKMAEIVHNKRLERNGTEGSFENQRVPYEQLSEVEKEKDRNQLLRAIETVKQGNTDYFDGKSHKIFKGNTGKAESNSKLSDRILNEINGQNKSAKLEELRKEITEQYKQATGEDLELTEEQVLSILDAHEQDGELGKLKLGELKVKVRILSEAITDENVRRFLLEAGFCGSEKNIKTDITQDIIRRLDYRGYSESTNTEIINFLHRGGTDAQNRLDYIDYIIGCHIEERNVPRLLELYENANIPMPNHRFEFMAHYTEHGIHEKYKYTSEIEKVLKKIKKLEDLGIGRIAIRDIDEYNKIERDFEKLSKLKDLGVLIDKQNIQELNNFEFNFENLKKLRDFGINLSHIHEKNIENFSKTERDFDKLKKLRDEFGIEVNVYNIEDFNSTERDFQKLNKLRSLGVGIDTYNIKEINNFKFDFEKLINLKNNGFNINNRREFSKLEISQEEIELCKEYGISHYYDVIFFLSITKNADRGKINDFINRKNKYLETNRTISEQKFKELFGGMGKYSKTEINQDGLGLCYAYTGFELLKKTNGFNELIQTNLKETPNGWEVRIPFCDPNGTRIKVNKNEIDKTITITKKNGDTKTECINSKGEMLGFKILEIAFMKKMIINRYQKAEKNIGGITIDYRYRDLKKAYEEFTNTGDITLTGILIGSLEGQGTGFLYDGVWETMLPEDYYTIHAHTEMKDLAFNEFSKGLHKIDLGYQKETINHHKSGTEIIITENEIFGFGIIVKNAKIINKSGETIEGKYSIDNEGNITEKIGNQSDIIGTPGGKNAVCFFPHHAYSIEKCYIDQTTGEKRVRVINPRHTGIKFDISLEQCKQIFDWDITGINIDNMFRDNGTSDQSIDSQKENKSDYFDGKSHKIFEGNTGNTESNSKLSDRILNEINEQNKSAKLEELRKEITKQYKEATGEDLKLSEEQLLSILDAHEQDGELGKLKLGELKVKVKILSETITDPKIRRFLLEAGFCGQEITESTQQRSNVERLEELGIEVDSWWIEDINNLEIDFEMFENFKKIGVKINDLSPYTIENLTKLKIDYKKLEELGKFGIKISLDNIKELNNRNIDQRTLTRMKKLGIINCWGQEQVNKSDIELFEKLKDIGVEITRIGNPLPEIVFEFKSLGLTERDFRFIEENKLTKYQEITLALLLKNNTNKKTIQEYINRKQKYLENNRTISPEKFTELFGGKGKYGKTEINQRDIGICYAYTGFEVLKKANCFDELIQTNLRESSDRTGWEIRLPFCDKNGERIKVNKDEIDLKVERKNNDGKTEFININSKSEFLGFKILEIAFIKKYILNQKNFPRTSKPIKEAQLEYKNTGKITFNNDLIELISNDGGNLGTFFDIMMKIYGENPWTIFSRSNTEELAKGISDHSKDIAFDNFNLGIIQIGLGTPYLTAEEFDTNSLNSNCKVVGQGKEYGIVVHDVKVIDKAGYNFKSAYEEIEEGLAIYKINEEGKYIGDDKIEGDLRDKVGTDLMTDITGKTICIFSSDHVYSIEKCYIDRNSGEKRVWVINPRHTGLKFDISLEEAKSIFRWNVTGFDIDAMFREQENTEETIDNQKENNSDYFNGKSHQFEVTETQARSNSENMDNLVNEINEENQKEKLQELKNNIEQQYKQATGEELQLTDEQLLSILDAHEQDGKLGELTLGQLRQKVKILNETIKDPKIRRFLLEAGFCGQEYSQRYKVFNEYEQNINISEINSLEQDILFDNTALSDWDFFDFTTLSDQPTFYSSVPTNSIKGSEAIYGKSRIKDDGDVFGGGGRGENWMPRMRKTLMTREGRSRLFVEKEPIQVGRIKGFNGEDLYWVSSDGNHRVVAAKEVGLSHILAEVKDNSIENGTKKVRVTDDRQLACSRIVRISKGYIDGEVIINPSGKFELHFYSGAFDGCHLPNNRLDKYVTKYVEQCGPINDEVVDILDDIDKDDNKIYYFDFDGKIPDKVFENYFNGNIDKIKKEFENKSDDIRMDEYKI